MARRARHWVQEAALAPQEKAAIGAACERFIADTLKPRFLREIQPTEFSYPVDIIGKWRGKSYSFALRYRSGFPENAGEEFDATFTRFDYLGRLAGSVRVAVLWKRHTGQWWLAHASVTLEEALRLVETDPHLRPPT
jgi:hypothetical protein